MRFKGAKARLIYYWISALVLSIFSYRKIIFVFPLNYLSHLLFFKMLEFHVCWPYVYGIMWMLFCRDHLETYTIDYTTQVLVGYCVVYIFMQTFMIPGTVFMSLLAGALFGVLKGVALVVFTATAGASSCYFLSKLIGRPLVFSLWPDKLSFFQEQVARRRGGLLNYMLFLRVTPTLPNTFINVASPIVDVPYHIFFLATLIGIIPAAYVTVKAGIALGELQSIGDLYDFNSIATLVSYRNRLYYPCINEQE
ncbi:hypothetical protein OIU74_014850 [Salix koriyanagi]|uniref:VTT domain-containing protein n=1 Tax=Salix koriyanagi TaxID=2511006 RepID=A0A9Q0PWR9_9ROSI|nr:hypothetical protein OIU74_014850 [Salix koriyanagi]